MTVCPPVHKYVYGEVPPPAVTVAEPVAAELHKTSVWAVIEADNTAGSVIVAELVFVQPLLSVTVTVYVPAVRFTAGFTVCPPVHR